MSIQAGWYWEAGQRAKKLRRDGSDPIVYDPIRNKMLNHNKSADLELAYLRKIGINIPK